uniref:Uncharacterized protein n=1 Tax=Arundo donax TaxID=35708 RepID=A0A0A9HZK9_ARUDO
MNRWLVVDSMIYRSGHAECSVVTYLLEC